MMSALANMRLFCLLCIIPWMSIAQTEEGTTEPIDKSALLESLSRFPGPYINRPKSISEKFEPQVITYNVDGLDGMYLLLEGNSISLRIPILKQWLHGVTNTGAYSVLFSHRVATDIQLGVSLIPAEEFMTLIDKQFLTIHIASLMNEYRDGFVLNNPDLSFRDTGHLAYLLAREAYYIDYTLLEERRMRPKALRNILYYVELPQGILEVSLQGPLDRIDGFISDFQSILGSISLDFEEVDED